MTISLISGAERGPIPFVNSEFSDNAGGGETIVTSPVHGGTYAYQFNTSASLIEKRFRIRAAGGVNRALFRSCRFYVRFDAVSGVSTATLCGIGAAGFSSGAPVVGVFIDSTNHLVVQEVGGTSDTSTKTITSLINDGIWHRIEFDVGWNSGAGARVFVDGVQWASFSTVTLAAQVEALIGMSGFNNTSNVYIDDVIWDDSTLGGSVGYNWKCVLLKAVADPASLNSWTLSGGGTSNLWSAISQIPPNDTVSSSNTIVNAASGGNLDYVATMQSYIDGGLKASDTVRSVMAFCRDAEDATTGTKSGGVWIGSNPTQTAGGGLAFDYGDDGGTAKVFVDHPNSPVVNPTVTLASRPTAGVRKTTSTTRQVDVDFLGIYVEYTPATVSAKPMKVAVLGL